MTEIVIDCHGEVDKDILFVPLVPVACRGIQNNSGSIEGLAICSLLARLATTIAGLTRTFVTTPPGSLSATLEALCFRLRARFSQTSVSRPSGEMVDQLVWKRLHRMADHISVQYFHLPSCQREASEMPTSRPFFCYHRRPSQTVRQGSDGV